MIDVKDLLLSLRRMRRRGRMLAIVGCESVLAGWESFCPFVLLSKSGCYFVGTTLIFVGTAVDYGRTSRASLLVNCESFCSFVLMSNPTSLLSKSICTSVNSHFLVSRPICVMRKMKLLFRVTKSQIRRRKILRKRAKLDFVRGC